MEKLLHLIDIFLLSQAQKIQDFLQEWIGMTCFTIARLGTVTLQVSLLGYVLADYLREDRLLAVSELIWSEILFLIIVKMIKLHEKRSRNHPEHANEFVVRYAPLRRLLIVLALVALTLRFYEYPYQSFLHKINGISDCFFWPSNFLVIYFISCTPKPPSRSKIRKFVESLSSSLSPKLSVSVA